MGSSYPPPRAGQAPVLGHLSRAAGLAHASFPSATLWHIPALQSPRGAPSPMDSPSGGGCLPLDINLGDLSLVCRTSRCWGQNSACRGARQVGDGDTRSISERDSPNPGAGSRAGLLCPGTATGSVAAHGEVGARGRGAYPAVTPGTSQRGRAVPRGQHGVRGLHSQQHR